MNEKTLGLTVYKYPENKFPHKEIIMLCYEKFDRMNYEIISAVYPAVDEPDKFNEDYFEFKGVSHGHLTDKCFFSLHMVKNISWFRMNDLLNETGSIFKEIITKS